MKVIYALQALSPTNTSCPTKLNEPFYMQEVSQTERCWKDQALIHHIRMRACTYAA